MRRKRVTNRRTIWHNNGWQFPQINVRHKTTNLGSRKVAEHQAGYIPKKNPKKLKNQTKTKQKLHTAPKHIIINYRKSKITLTLLKEDRGKKYLTYRETKIRIKYNFSSDTVQIITEWNI